MPFHNHCDLCEVAIKNKRSFKLIKFESLFNHINELYELLHSRSLTEDCTVCNACYQKHSRQLKLSDKPSPSSERFSSVESMDVDGKVTITTKTDQKLLCDKGVSCCLLVPDTIRLPVCVSAISHKYCSICQRKFHRTSSLEIINSVLYHGLLNDMIYLRSGFRCCKGHIVEGQLSLSAIQMLKKEYGTTSIISVDILTSMLNDIWSDWERCSTALQTKPIPIDYNHSLRYTDHDYLNSNGYSQARF